MRIQLDITNQKFGKLTALRLIKNNNASFWECKCECGNLFKAKAGNLRFGNVKSCGCLKREALKAGNKKGKNSQNWKGFGSIAGGFFSKIKRGARNRGINFNLNINQLWDLYEKQNKRCIISGVPISFSESTNKENGTASLDRIDSEGDYEISNVQWVHKDVNFMKSTMSSEKFLKWIEIIYKNKCN